MKLLKDLIARILFSKSVSETSLGRWNINYHQDVITKKVNQANEDHCGVCEKKMLFQEEMKDSKTDQDDKYFLPFVF